MRRGIWVWTLLVALLFGARVQGQEGPDYRSHFFDEVLTPAATEWTPRFDDYQPTSYRIDKLDLARNLPSYAARRGQELLGVLIIGPAGFLWSYQVVTFVRERERIRVVRTGFPHARVTSKATGTIGEADYRSLSRLLARVRGLAQAPTLGRVERALERRVIERGTESLGPEWQANVVFVDYREGVVFGELDETNYQELAGSVDPLLQQLKPSYGHGDRPIGSPQRAHNSVALVLLAEARDNPLTELGRELSAFGFGGLDRNATGLGLGFDISSRPFVLRDGPGGTPMTRLRLRYGLELSYGRQSAAHRTNDATLTLSRRRIVPKVGFEVFASHGLSLLALVGVRYGFSNLTSNGPSELSITRDNGAEREVVEAELSLGLEYYLPHSLFFGSVIGTRTGFVRPFYESPLVGAALHAPTDDRGAFTQLYIGLCLCRPVL